MDQEILPISEHKFGGKGKKAKRKKGGRKVSVIRFLIIFPILSLIQNYLILFLVRKVFILSLILINLFGKQNNKRPNPNKIQ